MFATEDVLGGNAQTTDKVRRVEIPLAYEGLKMESISLTPVGNSGTGVGLSVNADGTKFFLETSDGLSGETSREEYGSELKTAVSVRNTEYHVLVVGQTKATAPNMAEYYTYDVEQNMDWVHLSENGDEISLTVDALGEEAARGALVMVFSKDFWTSIETDSVAKYGDLKTALFGQEVVASRDNGEQIMGDIVKFEYSDNIWTSFDQAKEGEVVTGEFSVVGWVYQNYGEDDSQTFDEFEAKQSMEVGSVTNITGTDEGNQAITDGDWTGMGINEVWKVSCTSSLLSFGAQMCLLVEAVGADSGDMIGWMSMPSGLNCEQVTSKNGNPAVKVYGSSLYTGAFQLFVCDSSMMNFKKLIVIDVYGE